MGTGPTVRGTESEQDLGVASQMAGPSQKVECAWWAARGLSFERVQSPGLRVGPGSEWRQVTGWGLEWEGHIKEEAQGQSPGWGYDSGWGRFELRGGAILGRGRSRDGSGFPQHAFSPTQIRASRLEQIDKELLSAQDRVQQTEPQVPGGRS